MRTIGDALKSTERLSGMAGELAEMAGRFRLA